MQADQIVYLRPVETAPRGAAVEVGADHLPDVVLEVDYSTDVRRGKLGLYEDWGFPEVWVDVPDVGSPSRSRRREVGLTVHRLGAGGYRPAPVSTAFPGWTTSEIHAALNEPRLSEATSAVLIRVGRALGDAEGTVPDDDPWLREQRGEAARTAREAARAATLAAALQVLRARGIASPGVSRTPRRAGSSTPPSRAGTARTFSPARRRPIRLRPDGPGDPPRVSCACRHITLCRPDTLAALGAARRAAAGSSGDAGRPRRSRGGAACRRRLQRGCCRAASAGRSETGGVPRPATAGCCRASSADSDRACLRGCAGRR